MLFIQEFKTQNVFPGAGKSIFELYTSIPFYKNFEHKRIIDFKNKKFQLLSTNITIELSLVNY